VKRRLSDAEALTYILRFWIVVTVLVWGYLLWVVL
jgi:hypothetical protein